MSPALVIILVGSCVGASCALVGSFLVLRKMSLLGDAISHAVLPGIVIAFLVTGSRASVPMLLGAGSLGLLTVLLVELFNRSRRLREDASIGVVFPALFSLGVILISRYASQVDLDLDCVLYGEIAYAPLDTLTLAGRSIGPKALWVNGSILAVIALFVLFLYKELKLLSFDRAFGASLGLPMRRLEVLLTLLLVVVVVVGLQTVGVVLIVAALITPAAAARQWTDRLGSMILLAAGIGALAGVAGSLASALVPRLPTGPVIVVVSSGVLIVSLLFAPRRGLLWALLRERQVADRIRRVNLL